MKTTNSHVFEYENLKRHEPMLSYKDGESFEKWKELARIKLLELLGMPTEQCDPEFTIIEEEKKDGYTQYKFTVQTENGYFVPCYFLLPDIKADKIPLTICLSGHGPGMHILAGVIKDERDEENIAVWPHRAIGPRAVKEGRCALIIEARNFGESSLEGRGPSCTEAAKIAILMGRTVIGERVWDAMRILDVVLENFKMIDTNNIVCTGNSGGGTAAYYLTALEERITAAAPSCSVCIYEESIAAMKHCFCNHIPSIRKYFEMGDIAGLIVPRKLVIAAGETDHGFMISGTRKAYETIEHLYEINGVKDNCALVVADGGHFYYADQIWEKLHEMGV